MHVCNSAYLAYEYLLVIIVRLSVSNFLCVLEVEISLVGKVKVLISSPVL